MATIGKEGDLVISSQFYYAHLILSIVFFAELTRYVRSSALSQTNEEYVVVQQAFQATKTQKFHKTHYKNVLIPVITHGHVTTNVSN